MAGKAARTPVGRPGDSVLPIGRSEGGVEPDQEIVFVGQMAGVIGAALGDLALQIGIESITPLTLRMK